MKNFIKNFFTKTKHPANTNDLLPNSKNDNRSPTNKEFEHSYLQTLYQILELQKEIKQLDHLAEDLKIHIIREKENLRSDRGKEVCCSSKLLDCERCYNYFRGVCNTENDYDEYPSNTQTPYTIEAE